MITIPRASYAVFQIYILLAFQIYISLMAWRICQ
jgi:hypothetical protein